MGDKPEHAKEGWKALAEYVGVSKRTLMRRRDELKSAGVIYYRIKIMQNGGKQRVMFWFPTAILSYFLKKSEKGEMF